MMKTGYKKLILAKHIAAKCAKRRKPATDLARMDDGKLDGMLDKRIKVVRGYKEIVENHDRPHPERTSHEEEEKLQH